MALKPQDILLALKLSLNSAEEGYVPLANSLGMSPSEVHAGVRRLHASRLLMPGTKQVRRQPLANLIIYGLPYIFPAQLGAVTRGMPTAWAAPAFEGKISTGDQLPPVWPDPAGTIQGESVEPLYRSVPAAAQRDPEMYGLLAFIDGLRVGRARERALATAGIAALLKTDAS